MDELVIKYNPVYEDYLMGTGKRYNVLYGGRGSGKSIAAAQRQMLRLINEHGANHVILGVRKFKSSVYDSVFREMKNIIKEWNLGVYFTINETRMSLVYMPNGNEFITTGVDDPEKHKSKPITSGWIEEATDLEYYDFAELDLGLRGVRKFPMEWTLSFNPISEDHWLKKTFFDKKSDKVFTKRTTFLDNIFIGEESKQAYIEQYSHDENLHRVCILGEWGRIKTGAEYYVTFDRHKHVKQAYFSPDLPLHISFDFNRSPYITMLVFQVTKDDKEGVYYVNCLDEFCLEPPNNITENLCDAFIAKYKDKITMPLFVYGDASGRSRDTRGNQSDYDIIEFVLRKYISSDGIRVPRSNPQPLRKRRDFMNKMFGNGYPVRININPTCEKTIMDCENLLQDPLTGGAFKTRERHPLTKLVYEKYGHTNDSLSYFICEAFRNHFDAFEFKPLF